MFGFQKLDVYRLAIKFFGFANDLLNNIPKGYASISDQLRRASLSIPLNIAEGSGKSIRDGARFYAIARGSALECAAILDACEVVGIGTSDQLGAGRAMLDRIVAMLTAMIRRSDS